MPSSSCSHQCTFSFLFRYSDTPSWSLCRYRYLNIGYGTFPLFFQTIFGGNQPEEKCREIGCESAGVVLEVPGTFLGIGWHGVGDDFHFVMSHRWLWLRLVALHTSRKCPSLTWRSIKDPWNWEKHLQLRIIFTRFSGVIHMCEQVQPKTKDSWSSKIMTFFIRQLFLFLFGFCSFHFRPLVVKRIFHLSGVTSCTHPWPIARSSERRSCGKRSMTRSWHSGSGSSCCWPWRWAKNAKNQYEFMWIDGSIGDRFCQKNEGWQSNENCMEFTEGALGFRFRWLVICGRDLYCHYIDTNRMHWTFGGGA